MVTLYYNRNHIILNIYITYPYFKERLLAITNLSVSLRKIFPAADILVTD